ncbi:hypothetical protein MCY_00932 [Bartonella rattimassiliensis 15908]|uniref:Uncharacterized protein n=1 Tax=Bartonella rattimassiliensis 15908 TaxID=1094556 RepID=J0ZD86_9HYPH|nr:hypothetical protein MCY_00932 [Bartonella rattimassiliensis 15908]
MDGCIGKMVDQYTQAFDMSIWVYGGECAVKEAKNLNYHFHIWLKKG